MMYSNSELNQLESIGQAARQRKRVLRFEIAGKKCVPSILLKNDGVDNDKSVLSAFH